jgi:hypothetical protein
MSSVTPVASLVRTAANAGAAPKPNTPSVAKVAPPASLIPLNVPPRCIPPIASRKPDSDHERRNSKQGVRASAKRTGRTSETRPEHL